MINKDSIIKAYYLWENFKEEILYRNRFIINHEVLEYLRQFAEKNTKLINEGIVLYRARIYKEEAYFLRYLYDEENDSEMDDIDKQSIDRYKYDISVKQQIGFWGYNSEDSFVPPSNNNINDGRANPSYIKYLYTAEDPYTALVEVKPYLNSKVSVAEIKVNRPLNIADFSYESYKNFEGFEKDLMYFIMDDFSIPSDADHRDYIPIQYVAEFVKSLGFDGIKFNSSLHGIGRNVIIYSYEKCIPIGSKLYEIEDVCFEAKGLAPKNTKDLIHWKLEPYKEKSIEETLIRVRSKMLSLGRDLGSGNTSYNSEFPKSGKI